MTMKEVVPLKNSSENSDEHHKAHEALQAEYSDMASWYDSIWADYMNKTLIWPLRLVATIILGKLNIQNETTAATKKPITVVDVACGTGEFVKRLQATTAGGQEDSGVNAPVVNYHGVEPCLEMLQQAQQKTWNHDDCTNTPWVQSTAEALPLEDATVDVVCCTNAFHFFRNKPLALAQMYRVLKPDNGGGHLVITDWCADALIVRLYHLFERVRWNLWGGYSHRYPGPLLSSTMQQLVEEAGFQNVSVETYNVRFWTFIVWGMQTVTATKA